MTKHRAWFLSGAHAARPRSLRRTKGCCSSERISGALFAVLLSSSGPKTRPEEAVRKPLLSFALQTTPAALNASQPRRRQGSLKLPNGARTAARRCMCMCVHMDAGRARGAKWCFSIFFRIFPVAPTTAHPVESFLSVNLSHTGFTAAYLVDGTILGASLQLHIRVHKSRQSGRRGGRWERFRANP